MAEQLGLTLEQEQRLQKKYANKFVALCEGKVIASSESFKKTVARANEVAQGKKYLIHFVLPGKLLVLNVSHPA